MVGPGRAGAWLATVLLAAAPAQACQWVRRAEVPVRVIEGFPIVPAEIGGMPVSMLLDTGAQGHLVLPEAASSLGLRGVPGRTVRVFGTGGARDVAAVMLQGLALGGAAVPALMTPVIALPGVPRTAPALAGILGAPLLAAYDLDLDVPGGRIGLYDGRDCGATPPPIGPRMTILALDVTPEGEAFLPVRVNGENLLALLDTGARATLITERAARRLGLGAPISANTARGVDGEALPLQHVRAREMQVGNDLRLDVPISIAPLQLGRGDMLLGLDYLGQRRVWVSYATGRVAIALPDGLPGAAPSPAPSGR